MENDLKILQWNVNGLRPRKTELEKFIFERNLDLAYTQETFLSPNSNIRTTGLIQSDRIEQTAEEVESRF